MLAVSELRSMFSKSMFDFDLRNTHTSERIKGNNTPDVIIQSCSNRTHFIDRKQNFQQHFKPTLLSQIPICIQDSWENWDFLIFKDLQKENAYARFLISEVIDPSISCLFDDEEKQKDTFPYHQLSKT